ncbi:interleukin-1 family member 10-like isoform X1 [Pogona vitticeps]
MPPVRWELWIYLFVISSSLRIDKEEKGLQKNKTHKMESAMTESNVIHPKKNEKPHRRTWDQEIAGLFHGRELKPDNFTYAPVKEEGPRFYRIWDVNQKTIILMNNRLIATPRSSNKPEQLIYVLPNTNLDPEKQPIFMAPNNRRSLSCIKSGSRPQLQLVEQNIVELYKKKEKLSSFSFYSKTDGSLETCSFESAEFPGWFLSTSREPNKPVGLSQQGGTENTLFYFERKEEIGFITHDHHL